MIYFTHYLNINYISMRSIYTRKRKNRYYKWFFQIKDRLSNL